MAVVVVVVQCCCYCCCWQSRLCFAAVQLSFGSLLWSRLLLLMYMCCAAVIITLPVCLIQDATLLNARSVGHSANQAIRGTLGGTQCGSTARKISKNIQILQSKTFVSCSGNIMKVKKFYKLGAKS